MLNLYVHVYACASVLGLCALDYVSVYSCLYVYYTNG